MSNPIKFTPGKPLRFISTKSFALGGTDQSLLEGMEVWFDGTNVEFNGSKYALPTLRGAITRGWLVLAEEYEAGETEAPGPVSANIEIRSANDLGQNPLSPAKKKAIITVESDERIVMAQGERTTKAQAQTQSVRASQRKISNVASGGAEFGIPLQRTFSTPAKSSPEVTPNSVGQAISEAQNVKIEPGEGMSEDDFVTQMTEEEREEYFSKKEAKKAALLGVSVSSSGHTKVARVAPTPTKTQEGVKVGVTTGGGTEIFDPSGSTSKPVESVISQEGITFRTTNGPKKVAQQVETPKPSYQDDSQSKIDKDGTADARRKIAKAVCKDFPDSYDFSDHWKRRLANLRFNFDGKPDIIRAVFAAESDDFKRLIIEEFPEAFQS